MKMKSLRVLFLAGVALAILSCITVNIYFPEAEVRKEAEAFVKDVQGADKDKKDEVKKDAVAEAASFSLFPVLYAQQETEVSTPAIRALKEAMKARFGQLVPHYDSGRVGILNNGYLQILNEDGLSLQDKSVLRKLVNDENKDRKGVYAEAAKALKVDASQVSRIEKIYGEYWIANAHAGWMVQKPDGSWGKK